MAYACLSGNGCFAVAVLALHLLQPELSPLNYAVSYYVHGAQGWLFTAGLLAWGLGSAALFLGLARSIRIHSRLRGSIRAGVGLSALAVWSASLEALEGMGVIAEFLAAGERLRALSVGDGDRELAELAVGTGIDSPYPYPLLLPQSRTEEILGARLAALGVQIERSVELVGLAQDDDAVTATLRHGDGRTDQVRARYLAGCDGARSLVRLPFHSGGLM